MSVTVSNLIPPPPTDHLAAGCAFGAGASAVPADGSKVNGRLSVSANTSNPFAGSTRVSFILGVLAGVDVDILDVSGRVVRTLPVGNLSIGLMP